MCYLIALFLTGCASWSIETYKGTGNEIVISEQITMMPKFSPGMWETRVTKILKASNPRNEPVTVRLKCVEPQQDFEMLVPAHSSREALVESNFARMYAPTCYNAEAPDTDFYKLHLL